MCRAQRYIMQLSIFEIIQFIRKHFLQSVYVPASTCTDIHLLSSVCWRTYVENNLTQRFITLFQLQCEINNFLFTRKYLKNVEELITTLDSINTRNLHSLQI